MQQSNPENVMDKKKKLKEVSKITSPVSQRFTLTANEFGCTN